MKTIAERLKYARESHKGWTQGKLAVVAGVSQSTIGNIEAGIREGRGSLPKIAKALAISHDWLADGEGEMLAVIAGYAPTPPVVPLAIAETAKTYVLEWRAWPFETVSRELWDSLTERQKGEAEFFIKQLAGAVSSSNTQPEKVQKMAY